MKEIDIDIFEAGRPSKDVLDCINACLNAIRVEPGKDLMERFASNMTYEELWGTLLLARDEIEALRTAAREEERD